MLLLLCALASVFASPAWCHVLEMPSVLPETNGGSIWAVLVAGSNGWGNYRHQADVCHAYQILHAHGVPDDHIIVMMTDDIANNTMNPTPGKIINRPGGPDVYHGVPKDYVGDAVTPENFLQIITGNATGLDKVGSGKVLKSGPNDHVFINLVDHGAPGIFGFPFIYHPGHHHPSLPVLKATDFIDGIKTMNKTKMYKQMVIYMEACESGSMFQKILPKDINVYAVSAASASEPSWACYYDKERGTLLGDVFSIKWMEDTDRENVTTETLHEQFKIVHKEVTTSHVMAWGNKSIAAEFLSLYMGNKSTGLEESWGPFPSSHDPCLDSAVISMDVPLRIMQETKKEALGDENEDEAQYWAREIAHLHRNRIWLSEVMIRLVHTMQLINGIKDKQLTTDHIFNEIMELENWTCYEANMQVFHDECFDIALNPFALNYMQTLVNLCEDGFTSVNFANAARLVCTHPPVYGIV